ncbi:MAG: TonB-dependent receptor [Gammaproteobacteria bacterium]|nr:TonB-dependent receptor [Gammaproteobacteria bacterium]MCF6230495.1 TonB-dependent receptor [Gammaproteobacteria bacterium]
MNRLLYSLLTLPISLLSTPVVAFEDEDDFYSEEIPIVLTSSRLKQPITEAPTAMTIIDRSRIKHSGARELAELFQMVPGMVVGFKAGDEPVVAYHGMSDQFSRRMQILIDGRAVYLPDVGGPDWSSLPLVIDNIERIEITRGSNAATYGSNSFLGVINIITRHSSESVGQHLNTINGNNTVNRITLRHGATFGNFDHRVTFKDEQSNYYDAPDHFLSSQIFTYRADYQINGQSHLTYQAGTTDKSGMDRQAGIFFPTKTKRYFQQVEWSKTDAFDNELTLQFYQSKIEKKAFYKRYYGALFVDEEDNVYNRRYDFEVEYSFTVNEKLRGVIGVSSREDKLISTIGFSTDAAIKIDTQRLFNTLEYRASHHWLIHFGAMLEAHNAMDKKISPRLTANYKVTESSTLRFGVSQAYRAPLAFERQAERILTFGPNSAYLFAIEPGVTVDAEEVTTLDLGYILNRRGYPYTLDFRLYREELKNLVTPYYWQPTNSITPAISFDNMTTATINGFEASFEYARKSFNALLTYSYTDIDHQNRVMITTPYPYSNSAPRHSASLLVTKIFNNGLTTSATYHYVDSFNWLGGWDPVERYDRLDLRVSAEVNIHNNKASVAIVMQNIFTDEYYDFDDRYLFTKRFYISFTMDLH